MSEERFRALKPVEPRYYTVEVSQSTHCCFVATVMDRRWDKEALSQGICECFEIEAARLITDALNNWAPANE